MSKKIWQVYLVVLALCVGSMAVIAEDEASPTESEEGTVPAASAIYLPLKPEFVVNYGGAGSRLKYLKAQVSVRVSSSEAANSVRHHLPYIRNNIVMLLASQTDETLSSQAGKDAMRETALAELRELLVREDGLTPESVVEVLFNSLTWH